MATRRKSSVRRKVRRKAVTHARIVKGAVKVAVRNPSVTVHVHAPPRCSSGTHPPGCNGPELVCQVIPIKTPIGTIEICACVHTPASR